MLVARNKNYKEAQENTAETERIHKDREQKLLKSKADSRKIISEKVDAARKEAKMRTEAAVHKSREEIARAKENLNAEEVKTQEKLQSSVPALAEAITEKLLGQKFSIDNSELINKV